jgi:hypothetical protein
VPVAAANARYGGSAAAEVVREVESPALGPGRAERGCGRGSNGGGGRRRRYGPRGVRSSRRGHAGPDGPVVDVWADVDGF